MLAAYGHRILIKRLDEDKVTSSIIEVVHLDETKESQFAVVISVGSKVKESIRPAQMVVTKKYCGTPVDVAPEGSVDKERLYVVTIDDILGVLS